SSGTHVKELALWRAAGVTPAPRWYLESGTDQATTLHLADERRAYALADLPTYAKLGGLASRILFAADTALTNPYTLYVARRPEPHSAVRDFATWATHAGREGLLALRLPDPPHSANVTNSHPLSRFIATLLSARAHLRACVAAS